MTAIYANGRGDEFWSVLGEYTPETRQAVFTQEATVRRSHKTGAQAIDFHVISAAHEDSLAGDAHLDRVFVR